MFQSAKLLSGRTYKVKADLVDAPSSFARGEILTFVRATESPANGHVICEFRTSEGAMKYLDMSASARADWRELLAPAGWLS